MTVSRRWLENLTDVHMERLCRFLAVFSLYLLLCGFTVPLFSLHSAWLAPVGFLFNAALFALGYGAQSLMCRLFHYTRKSPLWGDSPRDYYETRLAPFRWAGALLVGWGAKALLTLLIRLDILSLPGVFFDENSLIPWLFFAIAAAAFAVGGGCWFYPYRILLSVQSATVGFVLLMVAFFLYLFGGRGAVGPLSVCLFLYALCALVVINQTHIKHVSRGTTVTFMSAKSKGYNLMLSLSLIVIFLAVSGLLYTVLVGISVLFKMFLFLLFNSGSANEENVYKDPAEVSAEYSWFVFNSETPAASNQFYVFVLFLIAFVIFLAWLILRRVDAVRRFMAWLRQWILDLWEMLFGYTEAGPAKRTPYAYANYKDTERKIQRAAIRDYDTSREILYYADFQRDLDAKESMEAKIRFAYTTFVALIKKRPMAIRPCHTPRQIAARLGADETYRHRIGGVTSEYELAAYGSVYDPEGAEAEAVLAELCRMVKDFMV